MVKNNRLKQTAVLLDTQEERRKKTEKKVLDAIQQLLEAQEEITFPKVAESAGVSKSYLYKWPQIKEYIRDLRGQKKLKKSSENSKEPGPHSIKTLHEISRNRIKELEAKNRDLTQQNQLLRGHVAEIYELRSECDRLRKRVRELTKPNNSKVIPLREDLADGLDHKNVSTIPQTTNFTSNISSEIQSSISELGIKLGKRLADEILKHPADKVLIAIQAYKQYREKVVVESPSACLLAMIRDEAEPNVAQSPSSDEDTTFDEWYATAIARDQVLDIPKSYLPSISGELQVRVKDSKNSNGFILMGWHEAMSLME